MADHNSLIIVKLNEQGKCLDSLATLLNDELTAIASRRGEGLKEIAQQKMPFLTKLNSLDKELNKLIANNDELSDEVPDLISIVRSKLEKCKKQNDVNAHAAHQAQLSVKQLKEILIGAPSSMTYDQAGSEVNTNSQLVRNLKA
ncbi:flagellar protein FlgN [Pseudoalteromonas fuliginea]|uniref:Flagellar biogenesis protein n=1 Tax=Pseudoalteromonas fuliginea TaxID=1872678 RepID=A0ABD3Y3S8_9GAMM|nr:flagellar protein FlgN [Pseudoalteromonas fuliginea]KDC48306.1 flagellar biogenesis protein [Pseudoalteromonas fuliginea]KJZ29523.1 flagellar biogenesis protein [Pseudoalteromonas fuliginea]